MGFKRLLCRLSSVLVLLFLASNVRAQTEELVSPVRPDVPANGTSLGAEVFARVHSSVVVLRTRLAGSERDSSSGSGFIVAPDGRAVTNFHVVADYLFEPEKFSLSYQMADGRTGKADVLAVDVLNDLAVVFLRGLPVGSVPVLNLPDAAQPTVPALGEAVFAIGNPLDLGVTVSAGSYSGILSGTFESRIHFTGPVNAGMSGGPAVDGAGRLVGINVARSVEGQSVSFLVPAAHAARLFGRTTAATVNPEAVKAMVRERLLMRQKEIATLAFSAPWSSETLGPYRVPGFLEAYMDCGGGSNDSSANPPPARNQRINCRFKSTIMTQPGNFNTPVSYRYSLYQSREAGRLNAFQLTQMANGDFLAHLATRRTKIMARQHCTDHFAQAGKGGGLPIRLVWCAQAYRGFADLFDVDMAVAAQDDDGAVLVARLALEGVAWDTAVDYTRRMLEGIERP